MKKTLVALLLSASLLGCQGETRIDYKFIQVVKEQNTGLTQKIELVVNDYEQWSNLWQLTMSNHLPTPEVPEIDFEKYSVVAVYLGQRNTGGYDLNIVSIEDAGEIIDIYVEAKSPPPGSIVTMAFTSPVHIVQTEKITKPARFIYMSKTALDVHSRF